MSSEESNKTSKQTHSQDSLYDAMFDDLLEEANDMSSPDLTDMIWATARKESFKKVQKCIRMNYTCRHFMI